MNRWMIAAGFIRKLRCSNLQGAILTLVSTARDPSSPISQYHKTDPERHFGKTGCFLRMAFDGPTHLREIVFLLESEENV